MGPTNSMKNIEWWCQTGVVFRVMTDDWWVMSDDWWVTEIEWWKLSDKKKKKQTRPKLMRFFHLILQKNSCPLLTKRTKNNPNLTIQNQTIRPQQMVSIDANPAMMWIGAASLFSISKIIGWCRKDYLLFAKRV